MPQADDRDVGLDGDLAGDDLGLDLESSDTDGNTEPARSSFAIAVLRSATVQTLVIMTAVSVVSWSTSQALTARLFVLSPPADQWPETIISSIYSHVNANHLIGNAIVIAVAGYIIERKSSWVRFHLFFVSTGATAGVIQLWFANNISWSIATSPETTAVLGASGAAFALVGYVLTGNIVADGILGSLPLGRFDMGAVLLVGAIAIAIWQSPPGTGVTAHAVGLFLGLVAGRAHLLRAQ